jgi:hypothetical protein
MRKWFLDCVFYTGLPQCELEFTDSALLFSTFSVFVNTTYITNSPVNSWQSKPAKDFINDISCHTIENSLKESNISAVKADEFVFLLYGLFYTLEYHTTVSWSNLDNTETQL